MPAVGETIRLGADAIGLPPGMGLELDLSSSEGGEAFTSDPPPPASLEAGWMGVDCVLLAGILLAGDVKLGLALELLPPSSLLRVRPLVGCERLEEGVAVGGTRRGMPPWPAAAAAPFMLLACSREVVWPRRPRRRREASSERILRVRHQVKNYGQVSACYHGNHTLTERSLTPTLPTMCLHV